MCYLPSKDLDHILLHTESLWADARGERFFITGGTGFVGTWLAESLLWANRRLDLGISATLLTRNPKAFSQRCPHLANDAAITLHTGDAVDFQYPQGTFPLVIHAATERYAAPSPDLPPQNCDRDVAATRHVLDLARTRGGRRMLFTSSGAVYGKQPPELGNVPESFPAAPNWGTPESPYAQGKRASELLCSGYAEFCGFDVTIARLFAFTGPRLPLDENYAAGNFVRDALAHEPIRIAGDGTAYRSYLYAADLAIWLWTILFRGKSAYPYNVGSPDAISIAGLAHTVASGAPVEIARPAVPGEPAPRYVPDTARAQRELGLRVWIPLEEGLRRMVDWNAK